MKEQKHSGSQLKAQDTVLGIIYSGYRLEVSQFNTDTTFNLIKGPNKKTRINPGFFVLSYKVIETVGV